MAEPRRRIRNILIRNDELRQSIHHIKGQETRIDPHRLLGSTNSGRNNIACDKSICIHIILLGSMEDMSYGNYTMNEWLRKPQ